MKRGPLVVERKLIAASSDADKLKGVNEVISSRPAVDRLTVSRLGKNSSRAALVNLVRGAPATPPASLHKCSGLRAGRTLYIFV